jgi:hypothetical protein
LTAKTFCADMRSAASLFSAAAEFAALAALSELVLVGLDAGAAGRFLGGGDVVTLARSASTES